MELIMEKNQKIKVSKKRKEAKEKITNKYILA